MFLDRHGKERAAIPPVIVANAFLTTLERIDLEVEEDRGAQGGKGAAPDVDAGCFLDHEVDLQTLVAQGKEVAVITEIEEFVTITLWTLPGKVVELIVAVEMNFEGLVPGFVAGEELFLDVRHTGGGKQRWASSPRPRRCR